ATVMAARGAIQFANSDPEAARACFEDAIDIFLSCEATFDAARVRLDYATLLERLARPAAAIQQAMLAQAAFAQLGAALYRDRASALIARLSGNIGAPPADSPIPYGLTPREAEVLWLIAAGRTNQDIALELVLSVRTVERHI